MDVKIKDIKKGDIFWDKWKQFMAITNSTQIDQGRGVSIKYKQWIVKVKHLNGGDGDVYICYTEDNCPRLTSSNIYIGMQELP